MRTTTATNWRFYFTISDLGRFIGKSPVTLRGWEHRGLVSIPRDQSGDRKLTTSDVRAIADNARANKRISVGRYNLVSATMTMLEEIEQSNNRKAQK